MTSRRSELSAIGKSISDDVAGVFSRGQASQKDDDMEGSEHAGDVLDNIVGIAKDVGSFILGEEGSKNSQVGWAGPKGNAIAHVKSRSTGTEMLADDRATLTPDDEGVFSFLHGNIYPIFTVPSHDSTADDITPDDMSLEAKSTSSLPEKRAQTGKFDE